MDKNREKYYDIVVDKASKTAEVLIYGVIGDSFWLESVTAKQFVSDFRNLEKENDRINVRINSPGGSVFDGLAIYNVISASQKDVHTFNDGLCASMGAVLLLAPKPENVHPAKNSLLMLHSPITGAYGNRKDFENALTVLDKVQQSLITSISSKSGLDPNDVESKYFDFNDHWFTADEAQAEGLYLNIDDTEAEGVPQNAFAMKLTDLAKLYQQPSNSIFSEWVNRIAPKQEPTPNENSNFIDMDISKLRNAYNLNEDDYATEESVLAYVAKREQELTDSTAAKEKAVADLATATQNITEKDAEIAARDQNVTELKAEIATLRGQSAGGSGSARTSTDEETKPKPEGPVSEGSKSIFDGIEAVSQAYLGKSINK